MTRAILLIALLFQVLFPKAPQQAGMAALEGVVVRQVTNQPLADVRVSLSDAGPFVTTKEDGRFSFKSVEPFAHRLIFSANGYVRQEYGQRVFPGAGSPIDLRPGQILTGLVVRLTPTGVVSGRIRDSEGSPISSVPVRLFRPGYDESGRPVLRQFGEALTDDLGEYRMYFITPGSYYVSAGTLLGVDDNYAPHPANNEFRELYAPRFYPDNTDVGNAKPVEVQPGVESRGIDLTLQKELQFRVRGRIADPDGGAATDRISIFLSFRDVLTGANRWGEHQATNQNGAFEFRGVAPGRYAVSVFAEETAASDQNDHISSGRSGFTPVEVSNADVDGVVVTLKRPGMIPGLVLDESGAPAHPGVWNISTGGPPIGAELRPVDEGQTSVMRPQFSRIGENGTFQVYNLLPGEYLFSIPGMRTEYAKEARFQGVDILNRPLRFSGSESGPLEIVISSKTGVIEGKVTTERMEPAAGAQIVLVPEQNRDRTRLFRGVMADQNGRFRVGEIVPGDYGLLAWEALEPYAYFSPELLRRFESRGARVQVGPSSKQTLDLKAIPAP